MASQERRQKIEICNLCGINFPSLPAQSHADTKMMLEKGNTRETALGEGIFPYVWLDMAIASKKTALHFACPQIHVPYWFPKHRKGVSNSL